MSGSHDIVLLGARGFVGKAVRSQLLEKHPHIDLCCVGREDYDLTKPDATAAAAQLWGPKSSVIICAARSKKPADSPETFAYNVQMATNIAEAMRLNPPRRVIHFSSAGIYGEESDNTKTGEDALPRPQTYYSLSKLASEHLLMLGLRGCPTSLLILRPSWIYGLGDPSTYGPSAFLRRARAGEEITMWGDGSECRDFVYVDDVARLTIDLLFSEHSGLVNICCGYSRSFCDSIKIIEKLMDKPLKVCTRPRTKRQANSAFMRSRLESMVKDAGCLTLEQGLERMIMGKE